MTDPPLKSTLRRVLRRAFQTATILSTLLLMAAIAFSIWAMSPRLYEVCSIEDTLYVQVERQQEQLLPDLRVFNHHILTRGWIIEFDGHRVEPKKEVWGIRYCWYRDADIHLWVCWFSLWYVIAACLVLPTVAALRWLWRTRGRFSLRTLCLAMLLVGLALGSWSLTSHWGAASVVKERDAWYLGQGSTRVPIDLFAPGGLKTVNGLPTMAPRHFLGNASSPFPGIVAYDEAYGYAPDAVQMPEEYWIHSSRRFTLWILGWNIPLEYWTRPGTTQI